MPVPARDATMGNDPSDTRVESGVRASAGPALERIDERYLILEVLGRGGMAVVYRARDVAKGTIVALKQLMLRKADRYYEASAELFEREFHTLAELSHPRIIQVHDYGVDPEGPYYTMELLDGGDLRDRAPLPWRAACQIVHDVCSSLSLLHSRRLVHRDVSPRNVRLTRDGRGKLIDLGAMVPMGPSGLIVGTPAFVAPEVLYRGNLDARADLFSLGATLYYALTGQTPFEVKDFSESFEAWVNKPLPPSHFAPDVPEALDALVLTLLSVEVASRPRTAFDVMQRLAAVASLERSEPIAVARAYLSTPALVGRGDTLDAFRREVTRALEGRGRSIVLHSHGGMGRSRVLDASVFAAKSAGALVLRAGGGAVRAEGFAVAHALACQLVEAAPDLALDAARSSGSLATLFSMERPGDETDLSKLARPRLGDLSSLAGEPRIEVHGSFLRWFLEVSRTRPLVLAVDDVFRIDEPSAALLATLATYVARYSVLIVSTAEDGAAAVDIEVLDVLCRSSQRLEIGPLDETQTEDLLGSVFGDVPNLSSLSRDVFRIAGGNPRTTMGIAQHLADRRIVRYEGGAWSLPEVLAAADLPASADDLSRARLAALSPLARNLVESQALASASSFSRDQYCRLAPDSEVASIDAAVAELVSVQVLVGDGRLHTIAYQGLAAHLLVGLSEADRRERHRALARVHHGRSEGQTVWHLLRAGAETEALDRLSVLIEEKKDSAFLFDEGLLHHEMGTLLERSLEVCERERRPPRQAYELMRWTASFGVPGGERFYWAVAPRWLERLVFDSGLDLWRASASVSDPVERLSGAMQGAFARYMATPEAERVYGPDEAVRALVLYVVMSLAIASRTLDLALLESLPGLLEPFAPLSATVNAIWSNALAARESVCRSRPERAHARWVELFEKLGTFSDTELEARDLIRRAVACALGSVEAWMGLPSASRWAEPMTDDPLQAVNALYLQRVVQLQQGDWEGAERFRKSAELRALQSRSRQMFTNLNSVELTAHTLARDLSGLRQTMDRIDGLAALAPGWVPYQRLGQARFQLLCGNFEAALAAFEAVLVLVAPDEASPYPLHGTWIGAVAGSVEALSGLGQDGKACAVGENALRTCGTLEIGIPALEITRALAVAEARNGAPARAAERLEEAARQQVALGTTGLLLGATYEARARVALIAADDAGFVEYARLTAREYRHGRGSALGARYESLLDEARRKGGAGVPELSDFLSRARSASATKGRTSATAMVTQALRGADGRTEWAERALGLMCEARVAAAGHLFLLDGSGGLRHAASRGVPPASEQVVRFAAEYLKAEAAELDVATAFAAAETPSPPSSVSFFVGAAGQTFVPVVLSALDGAATRYVGLALLAAPRARATPDNDLAVALAAHFLRVGDAAGRISGPEVGKAAPV